MYKGFQQEVRILCKQDSKEERPQIFIDNEDKDKQIFLRFHRFLLIMSFLFYL